MHVLSVENNVLFQSYKPRRFYSVVFYSRIAINCVCLFSEFRVALLKCNKCHCRHIIKKSDKSTQPKNGVRR